MVDFLQSLSQGLRGAAGVLSPDVYSAQMQQDELRRQEALQQRKEKQTQQEQQMNQIKEAIQNGSMDAAAGNAQLKALGYTGPEIGPTATAQKALGEFDPLRQKTRAENQQKLVEALQTAQTGGGTPEEQQKRIGQALLQYGTEEQQRDYTKSLLTPTMRGGRKDVQVLADGSVAIIDLDTNKVTKLGQTELGGKVRPTSAVLAMQRGALPGRGQGVTLTPEQNDALFGVNGAVTTGKLSPDRVNSRTAALLANAYLRNPNIDMNRLASDSTLMRNAQFMNKAITLETLPEVMKNMVEAGKNVDFSDVRTLGKIEMWKKGELNDPALVTYLTQRNDALMEIAFAMRGAGMSEGAIKMENEASSPTMSPTALDAWLKGQMKALAPRLKRMSHFTRTPASEIPGLEEASAPAAAPSKTASGATVSKW